MILPSALDLRFNEPGVHKLLWAVANAKTHNIHHRSPSLSLSLSLALALSLLPSSTYQAYTHTSADLRLTNHGNHMSYRLLSHIMWQKLRKYNTFAIYLFPNYLTFMLLFCNISIAQNCIPNFNNKFNLICRCGS